MNIRNVLIPVAALAVAAVAWATPAAASPLGHGIRPVRQATVAGPAFRAEVVVPVDRGLRGPRRVAAPGRRAGHYEVRMERYWVGEEIVAYDMYGHPVVRPGYWAEREVRVWVPHRRPVRVVHRPAPRGYIAVGFGTR